MQLYTQKQKAQIQNDTHTICCLLINRTSLLLALHLFFFFFFFNDTATTEIYTNLNTLSLHDALPISSHIQKSRMPSSACDWRSEEHPLNSSHIQKSRMLSSA